MISKSSSEIDGRKEMCCLNFHLSMLHGKMLTFIQHWLKEANSERKKDVNSGEHSGLMLEENNDKNAIV